jgi:hypothetical protein
MLRELTGITVIAAATLGTVAGDAEIAPSPCQPRVIDTERPNIPANPMG